MKKGYMYILKCSDNSYYTGIRLEEHQSGVGSNYTSKRLPVDLIYFEEYDRIDEAFIARSRFRAGVIKKKALIEGRLELLPRLARKIFRKNK